MNSTHRQIHFTSIISALIVSELSFFPNSEKKEWYFS